MGAPTFHVDRLGRSLLRAPRRIGHDIESWFEVPGSRTAAGAAAAGEHLLDHLDHLGSRTVERLHVEPYQGPVNRIPWPVPVLGACVAILVGVLGLTAFQSSQQSNSWLTSPGAGNEAIAAQQDQSPTPAGTPAQAMSAAPQAAAGTAAVVQVKLAVNPPPLGGMNGPDGQVHDAFVPGTFTMKVGTTYQVTVTNYDTAAHTWTSSDLGVNATIAAGTDSAPVTTTFTIRPTKAGAYTWECMTPCDDWAMTHDGYMRGTVTVEDD